ncbi:hypothetical protein BGZ60DRAFT_524050 [Tricladium varicosporioides]|nr:hypothetical protein BGZ60DRAFT_524050 [Hymenoscyphus varicosporioides]
MKINILPLVAAFAVVVQSLPGTLEDARLQSATSSNPAIEAIAGLSGSSCYYGDPLDNDSRYKYTESCQNNAPSTCRTAGYPVKNYCDGGSDRQCCIISNCRAPYANKLCWNTNGYTGCAEYASGYCPGPSNYKCCLEYK